MTEPTIRTFTDRAGVAWTVRLVTPERVERRRADRRHAAGAGAAGAAGAAATTERRRGADRRVTRQLRVRLPAEWAQGWLLLESETGERHRVAPVPPDWTRLSETALALLARLRGGESAGEH